MKKLYMIGNTHFDPVWLWKWDEAMASIRATFRSALDRMKEDESFLYSFATPPVFEWIKKTDPDMFLEIKQRVSEGRWELVEGWWVQPDCYAASGESYARHSLYGQKYLKENFGKCADGVFNVDSFGHNSQIPQILKKSHMQFYTFVRPKRTYLPLEQQLFYWKGIDGSEVLTFRTEDIYAKDLKGCMDGQASKKEDVMLLYGVTDHGGAPTKKMIAEIHDTPNAQFSTVSRFFREHTDCAYTYEGELLTGDFGTFSNHSKVKKLNRLAEIAIQNAEAASVLAGRDERKALEACWRDVMFNQFHDIMGGTCIKEAYFDAENTLGRAIQSANEITHYSLQSLTRQMKTVGKNPQDIWNLVLWNLNGNDYEGYIEAEVQWVHEFDWYDKGIELEDADGKRYPCQVIAAKAVIPKFRSRFVFKAEVPSFGYKMYKVVQTGAEEETREIDASHIETETLKIDFSQDGVISAVYDKKSGKQLCGELLAPICYYDDGDTWCFNIEEYAKTPERFALRDVKVIEAGKVRTVVKLTYTFKASLLEMYYTFYPDEAYFDTFFRVNWNEKHYVFKLESEVENAHTVAIPYGSAKRGESHADLPMGTWIQSKGISFVSDSVFAYNMIDNRLGMTVLRSSIYGDLRIAPICYDDDFDIMSQGISEGKLRVDFGGGSYDTEKRLTNPPIVVCESNHDGVLAAENRYFSIQADSVAISTVKQCEFDDSLIFRLYEYAGKAGEAVLKIGTTAFRFPFAPFEIKTLKYQNEQLTEVSLIEDETL